MSVKSILNTKGSAVETIEPNATAQDAALVMEERKIGALVVTTSDFVAGLLTHRDLAKGLARYGARLALLPITEGIVTRMGRDACGCREIDDFAAVISAFDACAERRAASN